MRRYALIIVLSVVVAVATAGCTSAKGATAQEKRDYVQKMKRDSLADIYKADPSIRARVESASGYGVFSNIGTNIIFVTTGNGYGLVVDSKTGKETYMKMAQVGVGLGLGVKDFRAVFVFRNPDVLNKFIYSGWEFGAQASAAAKADDKGGAAEAAGSLGEDIEVYQLTKNGIALEATVAGTKYWRDDELNAGR